MSRGHIEFLQVGTPPREAYALAPGATGLRGAVLSVDHATGAATVDVLAAPLWRWNEACALAVDVEVLMLDGTLAIAGRELVAGDYAWIGAGTPLQPVSSSGGARFLWMPGGDAVPGGERAPNLDVQRVPDMPWSAPPAFEGRSVEETVPGLTVKFLREDPVTGAYTLLSRHAPGWSDPRLEAHDTWEELLLLEGDYLMGSSGAVTAGTYIFRPGDRPHGPQASRHGAVWFCRGETRIDFQFTQPAWTSGQIAQYFARPTDTAPTPLFGRWY